MIDFFAMPDEQLVVAVQQLLQANFAWNRSLTLVLLGVRSPRICGFVNHGAHRRSSRGIARLMGDIAGGRAGDRDTDVVTVLFARLDLYTQLRLAVVSRRN